MWIDGIIIDTSRRRPLAAYHAINPINNCCRNRLRGTGAIVIAPERMENRTDIVCKWYSFIIARLLSLIRIRVDNTFAHDDTSLVQGRRQAGDVQ